MAKPMTPSEQLVGRRLPPEPTYRDQLLSGFVKTDGTFCSRAEPRDSWLRPAFAKMRKEGLLQAGLVIGFSHLKRDQSQMWSLRPAGEPLALEAVERCRERREARAQWSRDLVKAHKALQAARVARLGQEDVAEEGPSL